MKYKEYFKQYWREVVLVGLLLANVFVWVAVYQKQPSNLLHVYFLDIGQGDSVLIDSPTHRRILVDGGPNSKVLTELGKILPFGDRRIDIVVGSHPDADHIGGLVDVLEQYKVGVFIEPGVESPNKIDNVLRTRMKERNIPSILARRGMSVNLGDGVRLEILFPNKNVSNWETNDASIVAKLIYGDQSFLLTGDSTKKAESILLGLSPSTGSRQNSTLKSTVLKAGHHGSRTSSSFPYIEAVAPEYAVISAGAKNPYGHPHADVLDVFNRLNIKVVSTESARGLKGLGTIQFETDGKGLVLK